MRPPHRPIFAALLAAGLLLAGCDGGASPQESPTATPRPSTSATASSSPSASPSTTLSAAQQEAFQQATDVVMAYRQTITDLYTGARTRINDLDNYVTEPQLERERNAVQKGLASGRRSEPLGGQLRLVSAEPIRVRLKADPPRVVARVCIDATDLTGIAPDGSRESGVREQLDYVVIKTTYLPDPGWAVKRVTGEPDPQDRTC